MSTAAPAVAASAVLPAAPCPRLPEWYFLLPAAERGRLDRLILYGASADLEAALRQLRIADQVDTTIGPAPGDAVIALAGAAVPIESLARRVGDGGVLYWEVDRRLPGQLRLTPRRAYAMLAAQGLTPTAAYWVKPGFPDRHMYLPIASAAAFRWYLDTLYRSPSLMRRMLGRVLRAVAACGGLGTVAPCYAVTAVRGAARRPALVDLAAEEQDGAPAPEHAVLLAHANADWNRVALLPFRSGDTAPSTVVKVSPAATFNEQVEWEHHVLQDLQAALSPTMRRSIPGSRLTSWAARAVTIETAMNGAALSTRAGSAGVDALEDLRLCAYWVGTLHAETTTSRPIAQEWLSRHLVEGLCREYANGFGATDAETRLFARLQHELNRHPEATLPIAWQHGDFGPWNVFRDRYTINVIDWATARVGPALVDLLYFATHWSAAVTDRTSVAQRLDHFVSLFCTGAGSDRISRGVRDEVGAYMQRLGMHRSLLPAVLVYTFIEQALDRERRRTAAGRVSWDRATNVDVAYVEAMARHAATLFPEETWDEQ
jgi:hypothetical protein